LATSGTRATAPPAITLDSTEDDILRGLQVRNGLKMLLEKQRLAAVEGPLREQFDSELRSLTDAEQDSKELKSRKRDILLAKIQDELVLPFPGGEEDGLDSQTRGYVKKASDAIYKDLVRKKIAVDKRRPDGRGTEEVRPISTEVTISEASDEPRGRALAAGATVPPKATS